MDFKRMKTIAQVTDFNLSCFFISPSQFYELNTNHNKTKHKIKHKK